MIKKIIIMLCVVVTLSVHAYQQLSKHEFTTEFLRQLKTHFPKVTLTIVSDLNIQTQDFNGYKMSVFLNNAYDSYASGSKTTEQVYADQIKAIKNQQASYSNNDIKSILPVIKPRDYIENTKKQLKDTGYGKEQLPFYVKQLNDDLYQLYVFDTPSSMRFVSQEDVEKLGIENSIQNIAGQNLQQYYQKLGAQIKEVDTNGNGRIYMFVVDENYEASVLAVSDYLKQIMQASAQQFIVFIPARNLVLIVPTKEAKGLSIASNIAEQAYNEMGYSISPYGYININGKWQRYLPKPGNGE